MPAKDVAIPESETTGEPQLIQLRYAGDPFRMLACCVLLNKTSRKQLDKIVDELFERWPTPDAMMDADAAELGELIRPLGLWRQRTTSLRKMAAQWDAIGGGTVLPSVAQVYSLYGVGKYAVDSYEMFVRRDPDNVRPTDKELLRWKAWWDSAPEGTKSSSGMVKKEEKHP